MLEYTVGVHTFESYVDSVNKLCRAYGNRAKKLNDRHESAKEGKT